MRIPLPVPQVLVLLRAVSFLWEPSTRNPEETGDRRLSLAASACTKALSGAAVLPIWFHLGFEAVTNRMRYFSPACKHSGTMPFHFTVPSQRSWAAAGASASSAAMSATVADARASRIIARGGDTWTGTRPSNDAAYRRSIRFPPFTIRSSSTFAMQDRDRRAHALPRPRPRAAPPSSPHPIPPRRAMSSGFAAQWAGHRARHGKRITRAPSSPHSTACRRASSGSPGAESTSSQRNGPRTRNSDR